ncbi:MAG: hypothetical protein AAF235_04600 [Planctomycetota bacterium]
MFKTAFAITFILLSSLFVVSSVGQIAADPAAEADAAAGHVSVSEHDLVDLHVRDEDLGAVLQLLSAASRRNIVVSRNVEATVTASLYGVTFYDTLDALLHVNGFGYVERGGFVYVHTRDELEEIRAATRERATRVIELDFLNAVDAARFVAPLLSEEGTITTPGAAEDFAIPSSAPTGKDDYASHAIVVVNDFDENIIAIEDVLKQIDTRPTQVLIEATILQARITEANAFGIDFSIIADLNFDDLVNPLSAVSRMLDGTDAGDGNTQPLVPGDNVGRALTSSVGNASGPATLRVGVIDQDVAVFLRVLDEVTDVTVISNPKVLTLNRQPARVLVGTRVGFLSTTTTETATTETVEFLDTGTQLHVRPFVTRDGLIRMEIKPQVSSATLRDAQGSQGQTLTVPDEDTTELVTNLYVRDGQTVVLGGLFTESTTSSRRQVPLLGDLPIVGAPFRGHDDSISRNELIFLVTPSIVSDEVLTLEGRRATEYVELARVGARQGLLPWSRERQVGHLLIEAEELAASGDRERAALQVQRALTLQPQSADAIALRDRLAGSDSGWPSRSIIEQVLEREARREAP